MPEIVSTRSCSGRFFSRETLHPAKTARCLDHFRLAVCPACGLNGILDLRINVVNPGISDRFGKEGVLGVSENLGRF